MSVTSSKTSYAGFLPSWLWVVVGLQVVIVSGFALTTLFNPPPDFNYTTMAYITRNLTAVLVLVIAVLLRSHVALFAGLAARCVTDIVDATTVFTMNATELRSVVLMVVALLILPALAGLIYLWGRMKDMNDMKEG